MVNLLAGLNPDFEHGDMSHWTTANGTNDTIATSQVQKHHDLWSCKADVDTNATSYAYAYQIVADNAQLYLRAYVMFTQPITSNGNVMRILGLYHGGSVVAHMGIAPDADSTRFYITYISSGTTYTTTYWDYGSYIDTATWFCLELYVKVAADSTGICRGYINGTLRMEALNLDNDNYADHLDRVYIGILTVTDITAARQVYVDCVYVDTTGPIGVESSGVAYKVACRRNLVGCGLQVRLPKFNSRLLGGKFTVGKIV